MSKKSKSEAKKRRVGNKRATKAANQLKWQSYAGTESNRKKRSGNRKSNHGLTKHSHPHGPCGNIGCLKDSPTARTAHVKLLLKTSGTHHAQRAADRYGIILAV